MLVYSVSILMKRLTSHFVILALISLAGVASAAPSINPFHTILSGVKDTSNMWYGFGHTGYDFFMVTQAADPTYYLNSISLVPGSTWNAGLTFDISNSLGQGSSAYTLGNALNSNQTYIWGSVANHSFAFNSSVPNGIYNFNLQFKGGTTSTSSDILLDQALQVEIVNGVNATEISVLDHSTILRGGTATSTVTLQNNMTRDFVVTNTGISGNGNPNGFLSANFLGTWQGQSIAGGSSRTDLHSSWTASSTQATGVYSQDALIIGGLYNGDGFYFGTPGNTTINVVPEPGSFLGLAGFGLLIGGLRRRKA